MPYKIYGKKKLFDSICTTKDSAYISGSVIKVNNAGVDLKFNPVVSAFSPKSQMRIAFPENEQIQI